MATSVNPNEIGQTNGGVALNQGTRPATPAQPTSASVTPTTPKFTPPSNNGDPNGNGFTGGRHSGDTPNNPKPVEPAKPVEPTKPAAPAQPTPVQPQPEKPVPAEAPKPTTPKVTAPSDPNGTGTVTGGYTGKTPDNPPPTKPVEPAKPVEPTKPAEPAKPVEPTKPAEPVKPIPEKPVPAEAPKPKVPDDPNGNDTTKVKVKQPDPEPAPKKPDPEPTPKKPDPEPAPKKPDPEPAPEKPVDEGVEKPKEPETQPKVAPAATPESPEKKYGTATSNATHQGMRSIDNALKHQSQNKDSVYGFGIGANINKDDVIGTSGGFDLSAGAGRKVGKDDKTFVDVVGAATIGKDESGFRVGTNLHRDLNEKTSVSAGLSAFFGKGTQNDIGATANREIATHLGVNHRVSENVSLNAGVKAGVANFADGASKTIVGGNLGAHYQNGNLGLGANASVDKFGVAAGVQAHYTKTNVQYDSHVIERSDFIPQVEQVKTQSFNMEMRSLFAFDKAQLQRVPQWHDMANLIATTPLTNGKTVLQESIEKGYPIVIKGATDAYGDAIKKNMPLSNERAHALQKNMLEHFTENKEKYGLSDADLTKVKQLMVIKAVGENEVSVSEKQINESVKQYMKDNPKATERQAHLYVQQNITNVDRYVSIQIDTKGDPNALQVSNETMRNVENRTQAMGAHMHKHEQVQEKVVGEIEQKTQVGEITVRRRTNEVVEVKDGSGNKVEDPTQRQHIIQQFEAKHGVSFDASSLHKAIANQNAAQAQTQPQLEQPALEQNNPSMRPH